MSKTTNNRNMNPKANSTNRNMPSKSNTAKALSSNKKKSIDKVAVGIVVLAVILIGLVGTQLVINGPSTSSSSSSNYSYFSDLNNTFSAKFLEKLNAYRSENGLNNLSRVSKVSNGSSSTFTLPNLNTIAKENNCDTEDKLATVVLQKFLASAENKQIATATVSKIYLDTTVSNNTLNLTVKVPFEN